MIIEVKELDYLGFHLELVEGSGWKVVLKNMDYLFPTLQVAQSACRQALFMFDVSGGRKITPTK